MLAQKFGLYPDSLDALGCRAVFNDHWGIDPKAPKKHALDPFHVRLQMTIESASPDRVQNLVLRRGLEAALSHCCIFAWLEACLCAVLDTMMHRMTVSCARTVMTCFWFHLLYM